MDKIQVLGFKRTWWWRIVSDNGKLLATSDKKDYTSKQGALKTAARMADYHKFELEIIDGHDIRIL